MSHRFASECFLAGCADCRQKWLEEHVDTLPFTPDEMAEHEARYHPDIHCFGKGDK